MTSFHLFLACASFLAGLCAGWSGANQYMSYGAALQLNFDDWDVHP